MMGADKSKSTQQQPTDKVSTRLKSSEIRSICMQTNLIDREVHRRHGQFLALCPNGKMVKTEFTAVLQKIWPTGKVKNFANYLFNLYDADQHGYIDFTGFILLTYHLNDDKSCLASMFDMFDVRRKGYLSPKRAEALFKAILDLIGSETPDAPRGPRISYRQVAHLRRILNDQKNERLSRELFINLGNLTWIDEENGIGTVLIDQSC